MRQAQLEQAPMASSDAELVAWVRAGDGRAFETIIRRYNRRLWRIARGIVKDEAEAEDVVQEAYVRAFARLDQFEGPGGFASWIGTIAANEALERLRRRGRGPAPWRDGPDPCADDEQLVAMMTSNLPDPERLAASSEIRRLLEDAIDSLPDGFRAVVMLREVEQLSTAETAAILAIRPETVKTRLHRGRALLQKALGEKLTATAPGAFPFAGQRCDRTVAKVLARLGVAPAPQAGWSERRH
jgi:RNA polymerase sigma-70 factor (ECF subfamily)